MQLSELLGDKLVLLGFIYTRCSDINGCPLASYVMKKVQDGVARDDALNSQVRLISLSFDPSSGIRLAIPDHRLGGDATTYSGGLWPGSPEELR